MKKLGVILIMTLFFTTVTLLTVSFVLTAYNNINDTYYKAPTPLINFVFLDDQNNVNISYRIDDDRKINKKMYYLYQKESTTPALDDKNWKEIKDYRISYKLDENIYYVFIKNEDDHIFRVKDTEELGKVENLKISKDKVYLAINGEYNLLSTYSTLGNVTSTLTWISDDSTIASVDQEGHVKAHKKGKTKIKATILNEEVYADVTVTDLITLRPKEYNSKKSYLSCGRYTKEENDLLDEILKDRINEVGYKTRAGAVEAARFLALEFPYKIRYFSENGRGSTNGVDGEGRYYHVGLYLDESRYAGIRKKANGPKTWGCSLYSRPSHGSRSNGLDCSGFVSWVLLNGGFDVGDIGAGLAPHLDLTDYGERIKFNANVVNSGKVKVGDLLSSGGVNGGHIAIIVGEDNNYYYVAESLWTPPNVAVVIIPYSKKNLFNRYYYVMLMDSYYKEDGKLTKLWY